MAIAQRHFQKPLETNSKQKESTVAFHLKHSQKPEKRNQISITEIIYSYRIQKRSMLAIKLLCPSLSKVVHLRVPSDEQKIDLGSIARAFGLEPSTLKLNGHFISRGIDLIASSVTWNSLLSFFSAKGLSTGKHHHDALLVTGKLCKAGNKRGHDSQDAENGVCKVIEGENVGSSRGTQIETIDLLKNKKLRESKPDMLNGLGCKRKQLFEDVNLFKKLKINDEKSDIQDKVSDLAGKISRNQFTCCSYASKNQKRIRDEAIVAAHCKRIR
ncbi:uncharacterized protein G2W53_002481 [Senna tora]|uniref:Uncharacterized protein n=1 Tax=Senna tora TaxID=362788 RepID=A0A835CJM3_9FABA|nr:uncharacterized protein G2W53_002481 [Senna tora]